jgi:hypothetical protein
LQFQYLTSPEGRTLALKDLQRNELRRVLRPFASGRRDAAPPRPQPLPGSWLGQFRQPAQPLRYVPVQPDLVAEIEVDTAYEPIIVRARPTAARWRHQPRMLRIRNDMSTFDVPLVEPEPCPSPERGGADLEVQRGRRPQAERRPQIPPGALTARPALGCR